MTERGEITTVIVRFNNCGRATVGVVRKFGRLISFDNVPSQDFSEGALRNAVRSLPENQELDCRFDLVNKGVGGNFFITSDEPRP